MSTGLLALVMLSAGTMVRPAQAKPWITAYVGGWWFNSNDNGSMPIDNINFKGMTLCDHMGLLPLATSPFIDTAVVNGWVTNSMFVANSMKLTAAAHAAGVKCTFTIGAWNTESAFMSATTPANLPAFINSLVSFLRYRGYDGIDIDWEPLTNSDTTQYKNFIVALRKALPSPYLITVTTGWGEPYNVFASIQGYVDQINIMTYDMSWNSPGYNTWYSGAVYSNGVVDPYNNTTPAVSCNYLVGLFEAAGVKAGKLGIGSEAGGMLWKGCSGPDQSISTVTSETADVSYNTIMAQYYKPGLYHWDSGAEAAYLSYDTTGTANDWFLSYDDTTSLKAKLAYTQKAGIGGIIIYEIGMSYDQATGSNPFLQASEEYLDGSAPAPVASGSPLGVSITSPSNHSTISGSITVSANVTGGTAPTGLQFAVDGKTLGGVLKTASCLISLNTGSLSNGAHIISAAASDSAGATVTAYDTVNVQNVSGSQSTAMIIYGDTLSAPWINVSYNATVNLFNTSPVYSGNNSIEVVSNPWGALCLHDGNWGVSTCLDCSGYDSVSFRVLATKKTSFSVFLQNDSNQTFPSVSTPSIPAGQWILVTVPLAKLNPAGCKVQGIAIMDNSGAKRTYYVDDLELVGAGSKVVTQPYVDVYDDSLRSSWSDASYGATVNFSNTSTVYSGEDAIEVDAKGWGTLSVHHGTWGSSGLDPAVYDTLSFEVYETTTDQLAVLLQNDVSGSFSSAYVKVPLNQWTSVKVPIGTLDPSNLNFTRINIINPSSNSTTFYVDDLRLDSVLVTGRNKEAVTGVNGASANLPDKFSLSQNFPNPFNPTTTIDFALPAGRNVSISVFNILGQRVSTLVNGFLPAGDHSVVWNASGFASGVYIYRIHAGQFSMTKRMLLLK